MGMGKRIAEEKCKKEPVRKKDNFRSANFRVVIEKDRSEIDDRPVRLMVTHNGYQWSSLRVTPTELAEVGKVIDEYLKGLKDDDK